MPNILSPRPLLAVLLTLAVLAGTPLAAEARNTKGPWFMLVNADGTRGPASDGIFVNRSYGYPTGAYTVAIDYAKGQLSIERCVAVATTAEGAVGTLGVEFVSLGNFFRVWTTAGGALTDLPFYIVIHCPKPKKLG